MADRRFDPETRSRNMSAIRSKDTGIEMFVRRALYAAGFRFRLHRKDLPGKPDIVLPRYRMVIFVNGCFWHGHDCIEGHRPKSNTNTGRRARNLPNMSPKRCVSWSTTSMAKKPTRAA